MDKEKKNKVKGICGTLLFHFVLLFLLSLPFMSLRYEDPPIRKGGGSISIAMNFIKQDPPLPEKITQEIPEESETIENNDVITSKEGKVEVIDNINDNEEIPPVEEISPVEEITPMEEIPPIELTDQEKSYDQNKDGKLDEAERKKLEDFESTELYTREGNEEEDYDGEGEVEGKGKDNIKGEGFGEGLDWINSDNSIDPATLDCDQGKGTGGLTIEIIRSPYGKIVEFNETSFKSTITGFTFANDRQKKKLLNCIKEEYNETIDKGIKVKIYEKDHLHLLKLDFIN